MRAFVRLYPRRWRERYEAEFLDLLDERPMSATDRLDLVRGAIDAHLHPQLPGTDSGQPLTHRIPGLIALTAGLLMTANVTYLLVRENQDGDWGSLIGTAFVLMLISLPGDYMLAGHGRRIALGLAAIAACSVGFAAIPAWPIQVACAVVGYAVLLAGMLGLGGLRAGIGSRGRWLLVLGAIAVPVLIGIPAAVGLAQSGPRLGLALIAPYGVAWLLIGLLMALRGAPTIVDPPAVITEPEVHPA